VKLCIADRGFDRLIPCLLVVCHVSLHLHCHSFGHDWAPRWSYQPLIPLQTWC